MELPCTFFNFNHLGRKSFPKALQFPGLTKLCTGSTTPCEDDTAVATADCALTRLCSRSFLSWASPAGLCSKPPAGFLCLLSIASWSSAPAVSGGSFFLPAAQSLESLQW